jgi:hypothetical protein
VSDPYNPQNQPPQDYTSYPQQNQPPQGYTPPNAYGDPYNNSGYEAQNMSGTPQYAPQFPVPAGPGGGMAIAGLVLGIVSIVFCWIPFVNIGVSVTGIILSILGQRSVSRRTLAIVGLVLSILGLVIGLCWSGLIVAGIISASQHSTPSSSPSY